MSTQFGKAYWEAHWSDSGAVDAMPPHPALEVEMRELASGTALDAGSGEGAEASWLAARGWHVTAVDISHNALARAATRPSPDAGSVTFVEADLTMGKPDRQFDLVTTFYAHLSGPQNAFYERISR
jgi:2-polyprenyl-3-methyl-5-hydroxy-6-metoxy-1,4-benzoquinol methylase